MSAAPATSSRSRAPRPTCSSASCRTATPTFTKLGDTYFYDPRTMLPRSSLDSREQRGTEAVHLDQDCGRDPPIRRELLPPNFGGGTRQKPSRPAS